MAYDRPGIRPNAFKAAILEHKPQIGLWSSLCSNIAAEVISGSGFDWILIDTEHAPNEVPALLSQFAGHGQRNGRAGSALRLE